MKSLVGRVALLTGALGSLGRAQAETLAAAGASMILWDRPDRPDGLQFAADLAARTGARCDYVGLDLNDLKASDAKARGLVEERAGIDILVNNAALIINRPFEAFSLEEYEDQIRINSSAVARELGSHGVRVNAISPGAVVSEAEARVFGERLKQYNDWILENQCLKERIQPSAIADLVLFLVSPASDMITGQNIAIDGGW
jgi:NAD(P)-dependent dehydrogenase (short-subunit alcohol dehydrogenase family)